MQEDIRAPQDLRNLVRGPPTEKTHSFAQFEIIDRELEVRPVGAVSDEVQADVRSGIYGPSKCQ